MVENPRTANLFLNHYRNVLKLDDLEAVDARKIDKF